MDSGSKGESLLARLAMIVQVVESLCHMAERTQPCWEAAALKVIVAFRVTLSAASHLQAQYRRDKQAAQNEQELAEAVVKLAVGIDQLLTGLQNDLNLFIRAYGLGPHSVGDTYWSIRIVLGILDAR
jgi:hypothetical protein